MEITTFIRTHRNTILLLLEAFIPLLLMITPELSFAGMPWEGPICLVANSLQGPVATAVGVIAIAFGGLGMAFDEGSFFKFAMGIILGIGIAIFAGKFVIAMGGNSFAASNGCSIM